MMIFRKKFARIINFKRKKQRSTQEMIKSKSLEAVRERERERESYNLVK